VERSTLILGAVITVAGFLALLLGIIVAIKFRRQVHELRRRRRRAVLEPIILRYTGAADGTLLSFLGEPPAPLDRDVLEWILRDHIQAVRGSARDRLIRAFDELGLVDTYVERLQNGRPWARTDAAEKLGVMRSNRAQEPLAQAMDDPAPEVRIRAAKALGLLGGRGATAKLVAALMKPNLWSALRIADILASMGEESVTGLIEEIDKIPPASRLFVIDIFGRVRSLRAIPMLREQMRDPEPDIRARAAHALGQIGDPGSVPALLLALKDEAWPVRAMAAKALGRIPGNLQIEGLCSVLTDSQWWVRANAAEALKSKGEAGHRALVGILDSTDAYAREQAVFVLEESGVLEDYVAKLNSDDSTERERASALIERLVQMDCVDHLEDMVADHPDPGIRQNLAGLLDPMPQRGSA